MNARCRSDSLGATQFAALRFNAAHRRVWFRSHGGGGERFGLDTVEQCLWQRVGDAQDRRISLTPKAFAVLRYLLDNAGRLITHEEFLDAVWPGVYIQPEGLKSQILALRSALEDDARKPGFIEAVPRRGYRFIAGIAADGNAHATGASAAASSFLVGRDQPLSELRELLQRSTVHRQREIVFVTGETGIGKTSLVDEFLRHTQRLLPQALLARGQCVEGHGGTEPYYPMLEALGEMSKGEHGMRVLRTLANCAPTWLAQFPALMPPAQRLALQRELLGAKRERMLRELVNACEQLTSDSPLVLVFEDLQWIDASTVDLIEVLARTRTPMKCLLIGTYRAADLTSGDHRLRSLGPELQVHRLCHELSLEPLTEGEVATYLAAQAPAGAVLPDGLAGLIHRRTEGNPLFMVTVLDHLCQRGLLARDSGAWRLPAPLRTIDFEVPETLREVIDARISRLSAEEQHALEVASIAGFDFDPQSCADAAGLDPDRVDELCRTLADRHCILRRAHGGENGTPDDGTTRYAFAHAMYREVLCRRQSPGRRARLHLKFAHRPE